MWLFTKIGFYSVTVDPYRPERMQIRARVKEDLENLKYFAEANGITGLSEITEFPQANYRYRVFISHAKWVKLATRLAEDIDYSNFKNQIEDPARHSIYLKVWQVLKSLSSGYLDIHGN